MGRAERRYSIYSSPIMQQIKYSFKKMCIYITW